MTDEITIPALPCRSIDDVLIFYEALGFEVTYRQAKPNTYAVVERGGIALHFFSMREYDPANSYSTCIVLVPDVDALYRAFAAGLRQRYGKLPTAGIPRVTPLRDKSGGRGFNVIDPGGNWIQISQKGGVTESQSNDADTQKSPATKLSRAIVAAELLADSKGDYAAAAKMLDTALAHGEPASATQRVQALVARAALAITMGELPLARSILTDVWQIPLDEHERASLAAEFERADDLEKMLD